MTQLCGSVFVRESRTADCSVCHQHRNVSFYSESICAHCDSCPTCGAPAYQSFQSYGYLSFLHNDLRSGVKCTACGSKWKSRQELDQLVIERAQARQVRAEPICKLCGRDVHHRQTSPWAQLDGHGPSICPLCSNCPVCGVRMFHYNAEKRESVCGCCGTGWRDSAEFEQAKLRSISPLGTRPEFR